MPCIRPCFCSRATGRNSPAQIVAVKSVLMRVVVDDSDGGGGSGRQWSCWCRLISLVLRVGNGGGGVGGAD